MAENCSRCQKNVTIQGAVTFTNNLAESCWIEIRIILSIKLTPDYSVDQINSGLFRGYKITLCYSGAYIPLVVVWLRKQTFAKLTLMEWPVSQPKFFSAFFFLSLRFLLLCWDFYCIQCPVLYSEPCCYRGITVGLEPGLGTRRTACMVILPLSHCILQHTVATTTTTLSTYVDTTSAQLMQHILNLATTSNKRSQPHPQLSQPHLTNVASTSPT